MLNVNCMLKSQWVKVNVALVDQISELKLEPTEIQGLLLTLLTYKKLCHLAESDVYICTAMNSFALNKETHGPDLS